MLEPRRRRDFKDYVLRTDITDPRLLRDGERIRVPMMMADGASDAGRARFGDIAGYDGATGARHQPGPVRTLDQAALDARGAAYRAYDEEAANAWRTPPAGSADDALTNAPDRQNDALTTMDARERAYTEYDREQNNAWRNKE
jgi:hypothetical protein